jgi:hypothetical protein
MTQSLAIVLLVLGLTSPMVLQSVQEPPEYPDGQLCDPRGTVNVKGELMSPDHPCACHRVNRTEFCEGEPSHESVCKQWCHEKHCHCPVTCETAGHPHN